MAAKIIGHTSEVARFPTPTTSPAPTTPHLSTPPAASTPAKGSAGAANRQLNAAIHVIAIYQFSHPSPGREYYLKKLAESKTPKRPVGP